MNQGPKVGHQNHTVWEHQPLDSYQEPGRRPALHLGLWLVQYPVTALSRVSNVNSRSWV